MVQWLPWWLILSVNLSGLRDTQIDGRTFFLGMPVKVFLGEINIWVKKSHPHQCGWVASSNPEDPKEGEERGEFPLLSWDVHFLLTLDIRTLDPRKYNSSPVVVKPSDSDWITPPASLVLQLTDSLASQFP